MANRLLGCRYVIANITKNKAEALPAPEEREALSLPTPTQVEMGSFTRFLVRLRRIYCDHVRQFGDANVLSLAVAVIPRILFVLHAVFSVRLLEKYMKHEVIQTTLNSNLLIAWRPVMFPITPIYTGLILLLFESLYTIITRKGHEYKHIWFSGLFYLVTEIPVICCLEYAFFQKRKAYNTLSTKPVSSNETMMAITRAPYIPDTYLNCFHPGLEFNCTEKFIKNFAELGLISVIIIGRWMLPRGELTRDQLSALLIGYVNTAADLTEFIGLHSKDKISLEEIVTVIVLALYSISLMQFVVVTTSTTYEYSETEKEAIQSLSANLSQSRLQRYMKPLNKQISSSEMSKNVDCLTKDAFQSGRRARERRRGIGKATNKRNQSISQQTRGANSSCNLANETIYEESESNLETGAKANCKNEEDAETRIIKSVHKSTFEKEKGKSVVAQKRASLRSENLETWKNNLPVIVRLESVKRSLVEENWKELSQTLREMKISKVRETAKQSESLLMEKINDYQESDKMKEEENVDCDDDNDDTDVDDDDFDDNDKGDGDGRSSLHKWLEVVQTEMGGLLIALFLQEIPFFFTRVAFIYQYQVFDRGLIFYTTKNFFMLCFLNYRLWVATTEA